jgi:proline iminopeptidase
VILQGGPGGACDGNINDIFFDAEKYFVVEVDQRGCGLSTPSVQSDFRNMQEYLNISIDQMSADFEIVRQKLGIDKWLVFGGSWGSTLGLDYAERYPQQCLGLIIRGIFLNSRSEFDAVYARSSFDGDERRLKEYDIFYELAVREVERLGEPPLDPMDTERFIRIYESLILRGDRDAIWRFFVFENNLMEEDSQNLLDPFTIDEKSYPEATSVAFFESRLFLKGTFEDPIDLIGDSISNLKSLPTWVVQGTADEVCPVDYAQQLVTRLEEAGCPHTAYFVGGGGHRPSSSGMTNALKKCLTEFSQNYIKN